MKRIRWLINDRTIPNFGVAKHGQVSEPMPDELADKFIEQGEAEAIAEDQPKKKPVKEVNND